MDSLTLAFQDRTDLKKAAARRLRASGRIPAVVYGQGKSVSISVEEAEFSLNFHRFGENTIIQLKDGKTSFDVLVRDYQDDILTGKIRHIDFYQVSSTKTLHAKIPLHLAGTPAGVREGGLLEQLVHEVEVECLPKDLPHEIKVDVSNLLVGQSIHAGDLAGFAGVKFLLNADTVVAHVISTKTLNVEATPVVEETAATDTAAPAPEKKA
ncbi:MAG: 50S ribosomal protein L25 [Spirochaetales bacterium]|nr:50S ribosomal protein L25 [Spirochaetales bacterium]